MTERFLYELHKGCFRDNGVEMSIKDVLNTLNEQHEENTMIKQTIEDAIRTERTTLGKSVLKQLWDRIQ